MLYDTIIMMISYFHYMCTVQDLTTDDSDLKVWVGNLMYSYF